MSDGREEPAENPEVPQQHEAQQQPYPQQLQPPLQYVYSDNNIKAPTFDWESTDLPREFKTFRRYCELLLTTPHTILDLVTKP